MARDFGSQTLPLDESHPYDTRQSKKFSPNTWPHIFTAGADMLEACSKGSPPTGGWTTVHNEIAVLALPRRSQMRFNWANDLAVNDNRTRTATIDVA